MKPYRFTTCHTSAWWVDRCFLAIWWCGADVFDDTSTVTLPLVPGRYVVEVDAHSGAAEIVSGPLAGMATMRVDSDARGATS